SPGGAVTFALVGLELIWHLLRPDDGRLSPQLRGHLVRCSPVAYRLGFLMRTASAKDNHGLRDVSGARQRSGGVEQYSSTAPRQAPEPGSTAISPGPPSRISPAFFPAQLMQPPARSIPQPVQLQLDLGDVSPRLSLIMLRLIEKGAHAHLFPASWRTLAL